MPAFTEYAIAAGWNNAAGFVKIGLIVATSNIAFAEPAAQQGYTPGQVIPRLDLLTTTVGISSQLWTLGMTWEQYRYFQTTYCAGGFGGKMTVKTRWQNTAYANYNAVVRLQSENLNFNMTGFEDVQLTFFDLRAI